MTYRKLIATCTLALGAVLPHISPTPAFAQGPAPAEPPAMQVIEPAQMPAGPAEAALPAGAILHARVSSLGDLLTDMNALGMSFLPEKAIPQSQQYVLDMPNPVLALLTARAMGQPVSPAQVESMLGLDLASPVSLTFYPGPPPQAFVLALPIKDRVAISGLLFNALAPVEFARVDHASGPLYSIVPGNPDVPGSLFAIAGADTLYISGAAELAQAMLDLPAEHRLTSSARVTQAVAERGSENLLVIADFASLKPALPQLKPFAKLPPKAFEQLRAKVHQKLPAEKRMMIEHHLRSRFGIRDLDQALDYAEAFTSAIYETWFEVLYQQAEALDGATVSLDLSGGDQALSLAVFSSAIEGRKPLPMDDVLAALAVVPGDRLMVGASGQAAPAAVPQWVGRGLARLRQAMAERALPLTLVDALERYVAAVRPTQSLESKVAWTVRSRYTPPAEKQMDDFPTLAAYVEHELAHAQLPVALTVLPAQPEGFVEQHIAENAAIATADVEAARALQGEFSQGPRLYKWSATSHAEDVVGDVTRVVLEHRMRTEWGIFGYNEHELVNRKFTLYRPAGPYLLLHQGGRDPSVLMSVDVTTPRPLDPALARLIGESPEGATGLAVARVLPAFVDFIESLTQAEMWVREELDRYLVAINEAYGAADEQRLARVEAIEMPMLVHEVKLNTDSGRLYVTLPGGIAYPRPAVMTKIAPWFDSVRAVATEIGGAAYYERIADGRADFTLVQNTEGLGLLVRSVVNERAMHHGLNTLGYVQFLSELSSDLDARVREDPPIHRSARWLWLDR